MGCADFPRRSSGRRGDGSRSRYTITRWTTMRAAHFAAMEQPQLLVDDVRAFFRTVR
jgi:hypothetical protein